MGERVLERFKEELEEDLSVEAVYLFGSRARGDYSESSDFDFAVVSEDFENMGFRERQEIVLDKVRDVTDKPVEVLCYTPEEFERGKDGFIPEIIENEGVKG